VADQLGWATTYDAECRCLAPEHRVAEQPDRQPPDRQPGGGRRPGRGR